MANNRNYSPNTQENLRPSPSTLNDELLGVESTLNIESDSGGNVISATIKPFEGEIIELQKRHYDQASTSELLDRGFSEIAKSRDKLTTDNFFNLYQELFYNLPKQGKRSHTYLIEESTKFIGGYEDPKDDKIDSLLDKLTEIETAQIETPSEHPLFRNGTAIRYNKSIGIMQEGHLRSISNQGDGDNPSPYGQLKKTLGLKGADGKVLPDEDSYTIVTEQTWNSLPKWPAGTKIDEVADWSLTLSQFRYAASNITILTENVKTSQLDQFEINFLIKELENKTPFLGNTVEDLLDNVSPFTRPGSIKSELLVFYTGGEYGDARALDPISFINNIKGKYNSTEYRHIYDINNLKEVEEGGFQPKYGVHFQSLWIEELMELRSFIINDKFIQYRWQDVNPNSDSSFESTIIDGIQVYSGDVEWSPFNNGTYKGIAALAVINEIEELISTYENLNLLTQIELIQIGGPIN